MAQAGFNPGSSARQLCFNIVNDLNRLATMTGFTFANIFTQFCILELD